MLWQETVTRARARHCRSRWSGRSVLLVSLVLAAACAATVLAQMDAPADLVDEIPAELAGEQQQQQLEPVAAAAAANDRAAAAPPPPELREEEEQLRERAEERAAEETRVVPVDAGVPPPVMDLPASDGGADSGAVEPPAQPPSDLVHEAAGVFNPPQPAVMDEGASEPRDIDTASVDSLTRETTGAASTGTDEADNGATEAAASSLSTPIAPSPPVEEVPAPASPLEAAAGEARTAETELHAEVPAAGAAPVVEGSVDHRPLQEEQVPAVPLAEAAPVLAPEQAPPVQVDDPVQPSPSAPSGQVEAPGPATESADAPAPQEPTSVGTHREETMNAATDAISSNAESPDPAADEPDRQQEDKEDDEGEEKLKEEEDRQRLDGPAGLHEEVGLGDTVLRQLHEYATSGDAGSREAPSVANAAKSATPPPLAERMLQRLQPFFTNLGVPAGAAELSGYYYDAMYALYVEKNLTLFVQRVEAGIASSGHGRLHWLLGVLHASGLGVPHNDAKALLHFTFAAVQGIPEAHVALAHRHRYGQGLPLSCPAAAMHLREAADAVAMTYDGKPNPRPLQSRADLRMGVPPIGMGLPLTERDASQRMARSRANYVEVLRFRIEAGSVSALVELSMLYLAGTAGTRKNVAQAERYLLLAVEKGSAEACGLLGQLYAAGDPHAMPSPIAPDLAKALRYYREGEKSMEPRSLAGLGYLHAVGYLNNRRSPAERREDAQRAQEPAAAAAAAAAETAATDDTSPRDFDTAAAYFSEGASRGSAEGAYNLGVLHLHGRGAPRDLRRARQLFDEAASRGSVLANWQLARLAESEGNCASAVQLYARVTWSGSWNDDSAPASSPLTAGWETEMEEEAETEAEDGGQPAEQTDDAKASSRTGGGRDPAETGLGVWRRWRRHHSSAVARLRAAVASAGRQGDVLGTRSSGVPLAQFVEQLALLETGNWGAARRAVVLLDEDLTVVDEAESDAALADDAVVEAGHWGFAHGNALPAYVPLVSSPSADCVILQWRLPTVVTAAVSASADGAVPSIARAVPWVLSQREAKRLLLLRLLQRSCADTPASCLRLGDYYYYGESSLVGSDPARAFYFYKAAAKSNSARAQFNLGMMYQLGIGVTPLPYFSAEDGRVRQPAHPVDSAWDSAGQREWPAGPLTTPWVSGLRASPALAEAFRARVAPPNLVLNGLLRLLDGVLHNRAAPQHIWRYEGVGRSSSSPLLVLHRSDERLPAHDGSRARALAESRPGATDYFYDLTLAKRHYDNTVTFSGSANIATRLAMYALNVQWWTLYFGAGAIRAAVQRAAAPRADGVISAVDLARSFADELLPSALSLFGSPGKSTSSSSTPQTPGAAPGSTSAGPAPSQPLISARAGLWALWRAYVVAENYLLAFFVGLLFSILIILHHAV